MFLHSVRVLSTARVITGVVGYTGGMGPNITGTFDFGGTLNALVRATGNYSCRWS